MNVLKCVLPLLIACGSLMAQTVDYLVVGCGTAGAVMTRQLNEAGNASVVAIHNGPNLINDPIISCSKNAPLTVLSALLGELDPALNPLYETGISTEGDLWAVGLPGGGDSSINAGAWVRGSNDPYALWEGLAGPNWSLARILSAFKACETYQGTTPNPEFRGAHGAVNVRQDPNPGKVSEIFTLAWLNATGLPPVDDYNDPLTQVGITRQLQYSQNGPDGECRVTSQTAFLGPDIIDKHGFGVNGRNIEVKFNATAQRTLWNGTRAIGVEYLQDGVVKQVMASKGVIVCGGLLSSAFLMHSGVGPAATLTGLGIPVIFDSPGVGQHLIDQPLIVTVFTADPTDYNPNPAGVFSQICWLPTPTGDPALRELLFASANPVPGVVMGVMNLLLPLSLGEITITSANPTVPPQITTGHLTNTADLDLYVEYFQVYIKNLNLALQVINPLYQLVVPSPLLLDPGETTALEAYIRANVLSNQNFECHCRMAPFTDGGVVNGQGQVYGVQNLYVADASISATPVAGTSMAPAMMIAFNIASIITGQ